MQPRVDWPRSAVTAAQIEWLIIDAPSVQAESGLELVNRSLDVLADISADFGGGSVSRDSFAPMHGSAKLAITRDLDWGAALVRPYYILSSGSVSARFNQGVYHTSTPAHSLKESPATFDVEGYDMLYRLNQSVGDSYSISAGAAYLATVAQILTDRGYLVYSIDQSRSATVAPTSRTWASDDNLTWLTIVNDLLGSVGYAGIWSDWDGRLRCEPYISPVDRSIEWIYDDDVLTTLLTPDRFVVEDYFAAPNRWVVYRSNLGDGTPVVEGNGMYTYVNDAVGKTCVDARDGLVLTRRVGVDVADQAALIVRARQIIDADMSIPVKMPLTTFPVPLTWHFDKVLAADAASGPISDVQVTSWTLPLNGGLMSQNWRVLFR